MKLSSVVTILYAVLIIAGGFIGYRVAQSTASLVMGLATGVPLLVAGVVIWKGTIAGAYFAMALAMLLGLFFGYRFSITGRMMPAGLNFILSFVVLTVLLIQTFLTAARR